MNLAVVIFNSLGLLAILFAALGLTVGRGPRFGRESVAVFGALLALAFISHSSNLFRWSGIWNGLEPLEDFSQVLGPVLWCFLIYAYAQDMTTRKLEESRESYRALIEGAPELIFLIHEDSTILMANPRAANMIGYEPAEIIGKKLRDVLPPKIAEQRIKMFREILARGEGRRTQTERELPGGSVRHFLANMEPLKNGEGRYDRVLILSSDVTELKEAEKARIESERRYRELTDALPQAVYEMNLQGQLTFINRSGFEIFGYDQSDFDDGLGAFDMLAPEDRERAMENVRRAATDKQFGGREYNAIRKDGETFPAVVHTSPIIEDGKPVGLRGIIADISQVKKVEEEKEQLEEQLRHSQKMEAIGTLAGGIAHDFNNLLTGILGYADSLKYGPKSEERVLKAASVIQSAAERAAELTKQLLGFARKGKLLVQPVDVHQTIRDVSSLLGRTIDKKIEIVHELKARPAFASGDPTQIQQIVLNLAVNARDAMPEGGTLTFGTESVNLTQADLKPGEEIAPGEYLCIRVQDTGTGIPLEILDRVFEPFFTTKDQGDGTGMGLATVYGIVQNHGGRIEIESTKNGENQGTIFRAYLPVVDEEVLAEHKEISPPAPARGAGRILVIDDEEIVRDISTDLLESFGYEVETAENGRQALEYYRQHQSEIDLVIIDMIMPELNGRECFRAIRELNPEARAILSSGYSREGAVQEILDEGMLGFVQKPYRADQLCEAVAEALSDLIDEASGVSKSALSKNSDA